MKSKRKLLKTGLAGALLAVAAAGCGTMDVSRVSTPPPISTKAQTGERDGLKITADPFVTKETFKAYFGTGKPGPDLLVLHLKAENTSSQAAWILQKENLQLFAGDAQKGSATGPSVNGQVTAGEVVAGVGGALLCLPVLMVGNLVATDATVVEHNFMLREWLDTTIYPGKSREGFVYFKLTGKQTDSHYALSVKALDPASQQTTTFTVPFVYETP